MSFTWRISEGGCVSDCIAFSFLGIDAGAAVEVEDS